MTTFFRRASRARLLLALLLLWALALPGCASSEPWVELRGQRFTVELAMDDESRARGLMFREEMAQDRGMLFIHEEEAPLAYWMKNTRIPLDILYFDAERRLVSAQLGVPTCSAGDRCPPYPSERPALYVLELNAGVARRLGVQRGDTLTFSPEIERQLP
ncbi:DUF192 domain-containing protein [Coralloluteibacterium thermophilus]|uniref:DUF192 domain-containing protein n=1 Tax=Coralloluteibacterium thermophilum TaxID=2707049 RepID=A0ABV9NHY7_9GAMM